MKTHKEIHDHRIYMVNCFICIILFNLFNQCKPFFGLTPCDCQLSKVRRSFGDEPLDLKLYCCLSPFPMVTISPLAISCALLPMTSRSDKLLLETEPVARDNNTVEC